MKPSKSVLIEGDEMTEMTDLPDKKLLRVSEAAEYFGVHERTIRLWIEHGKLKSEKPAGTIFISRESIRAFRLHRRET
jgi:excisionase family DNA binding protein